VIPCIASLLLAFWRLTTCSVFLHSRADFANTLFVSGGVETGHPCERRAFELLSSQDKLGTKAGAPVEAEKRKADQP
jgi:hypothetical protein